ncbi:MAG: histidine phosphatase family protein [Planctomycetota bacterium]
MLLVIARHGKAESDAPTGLDEDRPLRHRGLMQARWLGDRLASFETPIEQLISSRAIRANRTATAIGEACGLDVKHNDQLFIGKPADALIDLVESLDAAAACLVGHNFQLTDAVGILLGRQIDPVRTGEGVVLEVDPADPIGTATLHDRLRLPREAAETI